MKYVTCVAWSWLNFRGEPGKPVAPGLPEDVVSHLLREGTIAVVPETVVPEAVVSEVVAPDVSTITPEA